MTHKEVLQYLHDYKNDYNLDKYIRYGSKVKHLKVLSNEKSGVKVGSEEMPQIQLEWEHRGECERDSFDAVCVANGHYAKPSVPELNGIERFTGETMHSIEYDDPSQFKDQVVLCIGGRASGSDLAREISAYAKHVYLSDTTCKKADSLDNLTYVPRTEAIQEDGTIEFGNSCEVSPKVDIIIFCTGYDYSFPFITDESNLDVDFIPGERRVKPLYKQMWHAQYPNLSFVGLPHSVLPFPLFELQLEAITRHFDENSGDALPSLRERLEAAKADAESGGAKGIDGRIQDTHFLGGAQWEYCREMAKLGDNYDDEMEKFIANNKVRGTK